METNSTEPPRLEPGQIWHCRAKLARKLDEEIQLVLTGSADTKILINFPIQFFQANFQPNGQENDYCATIRIINLADQAAWVQFDQNEPCRLAKDKLEKLIEGSTLAPLPAA